MLNLYSSLKSIPRITPQYKKGLEKLGLKTVRDFLFYFPFRYDDFSRTAPIAQDHLNQIVTIAGKVTKTKSARIWKRRLTITEITIEDDGGTPLKAVWFNQPFILETLKEGEAVRLSGKLTLDKKHFFMNSPAWEKSSRDATNTGRLVPIYSQIPGITSKWIRWQMKMMLPLAKSLPDVLPEDIRKKYHLPDVFTALSHIHFPDSKSKLLLSQKRFAFEEMLLVQLRALRIKKDWEHKNSTSIKFNEALIKNFVSHLPFQLTDAQRKASFEILKDLEKERPMNRLLNGDVGSGKTVVAAISALEVISSGQQVAIMAPTEVLARQHFESFCELFSDYKFRICLLTNSYKLVSGNLKLANSNSDKTNRNPNYKLPFTNYASINRNKLLEEISKGNIDLIIGTHAIIQKDVAFKNLTFIVIDEQHRFGVSQRAALQREAMDIEDGERKTIPHLLTMTATPIPRTLAIAFFGSLDLSVLDEMPQNRKSIKTKIVTPQNRPQVYQFIQGEIESGRQAFVILPLIEESKSAVMAEVKAAKEEYEKLSKIFPKFKLGLLHGKLKSKEKEKVMQNFKDKKLHLLVSTSVIEVGIDIPNATVMVIENAERFGLSQLHQFRGRVGRGKFQSYCLLFTGSDSKNTLERLSILAESNDGFRIAEKDLELRGPGQFFGTLQSGLPDIAMESLGNIKLIRFSRSEAQEILKNDPELKKHPLLENALMKFSEKVHLE